MEIRAFAERVLFSPSLDEKLTAPAGILSDEDPGRAILLPDGPVRPDDLRFAPTGERAPMPAMDDLKDDAARAVLLHAFANHELLATELMALALLRFPDAPTAFRRGLLRTLCDEQVHTRLYMERMRQCGLTFGSLPVNGFFWRHIAGMETPLDYVSRLSLTFEQANLDYSRHYAGVFHHLGDPDTGALLDRIYKDEIAHVGYGLKWFRRWKPPGMSDWESWQKVIRFPLTPERARGNAPYNSEGRHRAGLDPDFIDSLRLYSASRGRTPAVCVFNPSAEACALTNDPADAGAGSAMEPLAADLDLLPLFFCRREDVVLVRRRPSREHLTRLADAGISPAEFEVLTPGGHIAEDSPLRSRKLGALTPWGWSADSAALLGGLSGNVGGAARGAVPWDAEIRQLYAKSTAAAAARALSPDDPDSAGTVAHRMDEVLAALSALRTAGHARAVMKAPWSLAGRGMCQADTGGLTTREREWLIPVLESQGAVVVEPWLDRIADFSVQYSLTPGETPRCRGLVRLWNTPGGRFLGCSAGPSFGRLLPGEAARLLTGYGTDALYRERLPALLATLPGMTRLSGSLGVDAFFFRRPDGSVGLRPLVEINPRYTMGRITLELRRFAHTGRTITYRILTPSQRKKAGHPDFPSWAAALSASDPVRMVGCPGGPRIDAGTLPLNDPATARHFLAVLTVAGKPCGFP